MKKNAKKQPQALENFIKACADYSPFAVLVGIVFSFIFCCMIDYQFFSGVFYGAVAIFCAVFILVVRGALLFHSFNGFSTGRAGMGALSALLQVACVIWVCYEAPKVASLVSEHFEVQQNAAINFIRMVAIAATLLEVLMILSIKDMYLDDVEGDDDAAFNDVTANLAQKVIHTNGNGKHQGNGQAILHD